jgi:predicted dehydrogenase
MIPDALDAPALRWGILGPGWIAERFARAALANTRQEILAVASRSTDRAHEFAARVGIPRAYGSYEALVADEEVDVVYVATPNPSHHPCALLALEAGKHTLVEKPIALNATQAGEIASAARRAGVFCMEALWSFFLPKFDAIRKVIDDGLLGEPVAVLADHCEHFTPDHRIHAATLAGGPLLDLGTYPVALALSVLGEPERVAAAGQDAPTGVNGQASILLTHCGARQSVLHTTILSDTPNRAVIAGTEATLTTAGPFFMPGDFCVRSHARDDGRARRDPARLGTVYAEDHTPAVH